MRKPKPYIVWRSRRTGNWLMVTRKGWMGFGIYATQAEAMDAAYAHARGERS